MDFAVGLLLDEGDSLACGLGVNGVEGRLDDVGGDERVVRQGELRRVVGDLHVSAGDCAERIHLDCHIEGVQDLDCRDRGGQVEVGVESDSEGDQLAIGGCGRVDECSRRRACDVGVAKDGLVDSAGHQLQGDHLGLAGGDGGRGFDGDREGRLVDGCNRSDGSVEDSEVIRDRNTCDFHCVAVVIDECQREGDVSVVDGCGCGIGGEIRQESAVAVGRSDDDGCDCGNRLDVSCRVNGGHLERMGSDRDVIERKQCSCGIHHDGGRFVQRPLEFVNRAADGGDGECPGGRGVCGCGRVDSDCDHIEGEGSGICVVEWDFIGCDPCLDGMGACLQAGEFDARGDVGIGGECSSIEAVVVLGPACRVEGEDHSVGEDGRAAIGHGVADDCQCGGRCSDSPLEDGRSLLDCSGGAHGEELERMAAGRHRGECQGGVCRGDRGCAVEDVPVADRIGVWDEGEVDGGLHGGDTRRDCGSADCRLDCGDGLDRGLARADCERHRREDV